MNAPTGSANSGTKGDTQGPEYIADSLYPAPSTLDIFTSPHPSPSGMLTDDLPWPELGNVSRGATRGNQGQKGMLGPPDNEGRAILQLRVQPGVLPVRLNRQATEWYRILDSEVNRALKLTKTYWRKARRRQDYDARADQDHMELHEWLQQLKDKVMSHLELLMQKGEIQGPPYVMPEQVELTFLRKFIERQAAGIPHNPRLRNGSRSPRGVSQYADAKFSDVSSTPSMSWDPLDDRGDIFDLSSSEHQLIAHQIKLKMPLQHWRRSAATSMPSRARLSQIVSFLSCLSFWSLTGHSQNVFCVARGQHCRAPRRTLKIPSGGINRASTLKRKLCSR